LHFDKVSEVSFSLIKDETVAADVILSSGLKKTFEIIKDPYLGKQGDKIIPLPLESILRIKFMKS
jgi:hypothetical protein